MSTIDRIRELVLPILDDLGLALYDVEQSGSLRVLVDRGGGVSIDEIATATRLISRALDEADVIPGSYTLEVSSPGLERPLRTPAHFQGAVGSTVTVKTVEGHEGPRRISGELRSADEAGIVVHGEADDDHHLAYSDIQQARTTFDWGPAPKPKGGARRRSPDKKARA